jgi:hypothetical protein
VCKFSTFHTKFAVVDMLTESNMGGRAAVGLTAWVGLLALPGGALAGQDGGDSSVALTGEVCPERCEMTFLKK